MEDKIMAGAIILYSAIFGFFASYIAARSVVTFIFDLASSDWSPEEQNTQAKQDTGVVEASQAERSGLPGSNDP
jgi:hypothetical protein